MKLIVENINGSTYAYLESESHHRVAEKQRGGRRLHPQTLDHECDLSVYPNSYFVVDVKKTTKKEVSKLRRSP